MLIERHCSDPGNAEKRVTAASGRAYEFKHVDEKDREHSPRVVKVDDEDDIGCFLAIPEGYRIFKADRSEPAKIQRPPEAKASKATPKKAKKAKAKKAKTKAKAEPTPTPPVEGDDIVEGADDEISVDPADIIDGGVRAIRERLAETTYTADELEAALFAEKDGAGRKTVVSALEDALNDAQ